MDCIHSEVVLTCMLTELKYGSSSFFNKLLIVATAHSITSWIVRAASNVFKLIIVGKISISF